MNSHPRVNDRMVPDHLLGDAPNDPDTSEGGERKSKNAKTEFPNKWCVRECERSHLRNPYENEN